MYAQFLILGLLILLLLLSSPVKGVNFYGPRSEYIVSGSDCGNVFFWDKHTEAIINMGQGDNKGAVSALASWSF